MIHILENLRRIVFWSLDWFRGNKVKNHFRELELILNKPCDELIKSIVEEKRNQLLAHASETTPFYKSFKGFKELQDFPIINKNIILDKYSDFKSDRFLNVKLFKASSSGSTGIPFRVYQNKDKRLRSTAEAIFFSNILGNKLGDRLVYIKLWDHTNRKNRWTLFSQNILTHNVTDTSKTELQELISKLENDDSNKLILGYPSFFEELCKYLDSEKKKPKVQNVMGIISMAENLKDSERHRMAHYFKADVYERYSNQENGILAQQTPLSKENYTLNWASYYFEFLEFDSDRPVKEGEPGRIVVTDLYNYSMPMIRYDTGDVGIFITKEGEWPMLYKIYGRRMDAIFDTNGKLVSPFVFYQVLDFADVKQFQFIQNGNNSYLYKLNGSPQNVREQDIVNHFKRYLGSDADIQFEYVDEIPLLASGKRKKIVNTFKKV